MGMRCDEGGVGVRQQGDVMRRRLFTLSGVSVEVETFEQVAPATANDPPSSRATARHR